MDPYILALMEDGLDEVLQNEWTVSDGDALMDSEDEADLLAASRCSDQYGGNPTLHSQYGTNCADMSLERRCGRTACRSFSPYPAKAYRW